MSRGAARTHRAALSFACLVGCAPAEVAATQLVVTIEGEPSVLERLRRVRATLHTTDASGRAEATATHDFALTGMEPPLSFAVLAGLAPSVKLVVEGYDSLAPGAAPVVEQKRVAAFERDTALQLRVRLTSSCYALPNPCNVLDRTCWSDARACGPVPDAEVTREPTAAVPEAGTTESACSVPSPCPDDYPCTPTAPSGYACLGLHARWRIPLAGSRTEPRYDTRIPQVVVDANTGLVWQRERPLRYEGCTGLNRVPGDRCTADEARIYCSRLRLADRRWRLPSKVELESLLDHRGSLPTLDRSAFPSSDGVYWTSSPLPRSTAGDSSVTRYWATDFREGTAELLSPTLPLVARCVSGTPPSQGAPSERLSVDTDADTVHDRDTGLIWRRTESAPLSTLTEAVAHCAGLGGGWRLPDVKELLTTIDPARIDPALDPAFATPRSGLGWASAGKLNGGLEGWIVDALLGASFPLRLAEVSRDARHASAPIPHARCVRNAEDLR